MAERCECPSSAKAEDQSFRVAYHQKLTWLRQETNESIRTRPPSPTSPQYLDGFPFVSPLSSIFASLWSHLPPQNEAEHLITCFFRHLAWNGSPILEEDLMGVFRWLYALDSTMTAQSSMSFQRMALMYIVFALGSMLNLELAADDEAPKTYFQLSQQCLVSGRFLVHNSLTTVQTLSLMAKFAAYIEKRDLAWQIRGMATRVLLAMGLHRDGRSWNLSSKDLNDRRRTFWETYSTEVLMSSNWDRPSGLHSELFDTLLPEDYHHGAGFEKQRCRITMLAQEALQESLKVRTEYDKLKDIWRRILLVESETPYHLRNRAALSYMSSKYGSIAEVESETPPVSRDIRTVFQSHDLIDTASTVILSMFRPYFIQAAQSANPFMSPYAEAYLTIVERSNMLIANVKSLHDAFARVSTRHWFFWDHAFSGAVCMAAICIIDPGSPLVDQAMLALESILSLYTSIQPAVPQQWAGRNLQWLRELRKRGCEKINAFRAGHNPEARPANTRSEDEPEHLLVDGWKERLVNLGHRSGPAPPVELNNADGFDLSFDIPGSEDVSYED